MTQLKVAFLASCFAAGISIVSSVVGLVINSWLTQRRERRQQVWKTEINRIVDLEERAGQMVEWSGSYHPLKIVRDKVADDLTRLQSDAGRFRRHKGIMQAIRDLQIGLSCLLDDRLYDDDKLRDRDWRQTSSEVNARYDKLLSECDKVTGKRRL